MRKTRAISLLAITLASIAAYMTWAAWEPAPTIQSMKFEKTVDAVARSAAEADFRMHPPKGQTLTWDRFLSRLANPYQPREAPLIGVGVVPYTDGAEVLFIEYPRGQVWLRRSLVDGGWGGRMSFEP